MSIEEIKSEITKSLDKAPEPLLKEVLALLNGGGNIFSNEKEIEENLRKILTEDNNLLDRLAK